MILRLARNRWLDRHGHAVPAAVAGAATTLLRWAAGSGAAATIQITPEAPMQITEELNLTPTEDGRLVTPEGAPVPRDVFAHLQAAADAWEKLAHTERAHVGHIRYHFHVSGAVVVQPIDDPRKGKRALKV